MTVITRYTNSLNKVSKMISDGTAFVWIAYQVDALGICHLQKVSAHDLDQVYFDISVTTTSIVDMSISSNGTIGLLFDNANPTFMGKIYDTTQPLSTNDDITRPADVTEEPVAIAHGSFDTVYNVLLPGDSSATNAKVYKFSEFTGSLQNTFAVRVGDINIVEATSITVDSNDDIWIATHTNPVKLIRMYFESGALWKFAFTNIE